MRAPAILVAAAGLLPACLAQLTSTSKYPVGPLTSSSAKWDVKVCDVTKYGTPTTDLGPPLLAAFVSAPGVVHLRAID